MCLFAALSTKHRCLWIAMMTTRRMHTGIPTVRLVVCLSDGRLLRRAELAVKRGLCTRFAPRTVESCRFARASTFTCFVKWTTTGFMARNTVFEAFFLSATSRFIFHRVNFSLIDLLRFPWWLLSSTQFRSKNRFPTLVPFSSCWTDSLVHIWHRRTSQRQGSSQIYHRRPGTTGVISKQSSLVFHLRINLAITMQSNHVGGLLVFLSNWNDNDPLYLINYYNAFVLINL